MFTMNGTFMIEIVLINTWYFEMILVQQAVELRLCLTPDVAIWVDIINLWDYYMIFHMRISLISKVFNVVLLVKNAVDCLFDMVPVLFRLACFLLICIYQTATGVTCSHTVPSRVK